MAQQITFGASEEHGIAVAPDGKSLITSVGSRQYTVWVHTPKGERQISSEEFAFLASLSADGKTLYYLSRIGMGTVPSGQLWSVDLASGHKEQVLPGILVSRYSVSFDGKQVAFTRADSPGHSAIWISPVDRRSSPREIVSADADTPIFSRSGEIFFLREQGGAHYVFRMHKDGQLSKAHPNPVDGLVSLSPDGKWVVVSTHNDDPTRQAVVALALLGGRSRVLCQGCAVGSMEIDPPLVSWSMDQRSIYVSLAKTGLNDQPKTMLIPLRPGEAFPKLPSDELVNNPQLSRIPGLRTVNHPSVFPGPDPSIYAFWNTSTQRNLYRITLP